MKGTLKAEIIAVGTELLLGQIANTNAQWMSKQLSLHGVNMYYHTVVGDNLTRMEKTFQIAQSRSDVVIVTGGLGPTLDDVSREAFAKISQFTIVEEPVSLKKMTDFFAQKNQEMTINNKRQARVFHHSLVLENKVGMAPGNLVQYDGVAWIFLPGVPREMKQIFTDSVIPYLKKRNGAQVIQSKVLRFVGIGESAIEDKLLHLIENQTNPTIAPLAAEDGVTIRLTAKAGSESEALEKIVETEAHIKALVGHYCYGTDDDQLAEVVFRLLQGKNKKLACAESLTGGKFADAFVTLQGASTVFKGGVVCYDAAIKEHVLGVPAEVIRHQGTVSEACAEALAENVASLLHSSIGMSFTGVAGPAAIESKPVGTVYIGLYDDAGYSEVTKHHFHGDRAQIRKQTVTKGLEILFHYLK